MNAQENKLSKKWIGMAAVLLSVAVAHGNVIFLEEFDGNNKAYATNSATSPGNVWVDFNNRITETDIGTAVEGYSTASGGSASVLAGKATVNDLQIRSDFNVGITDATQVTNISWRVRADSDNNGSYSEIIGIAAIQFYVGTNAYGSKAANVIGAGDISMRTLAGVTTTVAASGGNGWVLYNHSFAPGTLTAIRSVRFDILDNVASSGQAFEVDYIKIDAISGPITNGMQQVDLSVCPPGVDQVDIYLLLGQSNMKGRGTVPPVQAGNPLIVNMNMADNFWYEARHPLHKAGVPDLIDESDNAGVGPGLDFARGVLSQTNGVRIALVPCAVGGSRIDLWAPGGSFYTNTIYRAQKALTDGPVGKTRIKGILWLQGESDAIDTLYAAYKSKLTNIVQHLRTDLNEPDLPFIACTIGSFINSNNYPRVSEINNALLSLPESELNTACVDARDLTGHIGDFLHYNTESQVIIGGRYADALQLVNDNSSTSPFVEWAGKGLSMTPELLVQYAIGGAAGPTASNEQVAVRTTESLFTLVAVIRTNDPQLSVAGQMTTNLTGLWEDLTNNPYGVPSATQTNVPAGCERRDFSISSATDPVKFLRLRVVHSAP